MPGPPSTTPSLTRRPEPSTGAFRSHPAFFLGDAGIDVNWGIVSPSSTARIGACPGLLKVYHPYQRPLRGWVQTVATGNFVAYYRVSTDKQGRSGLGLEAQQSAVAAFLNGGTWKLVRDFTEVESGKRNDNRPKLAAAIQACRVYGAKLVIAKLDRLSRDAHFLLGLEKAGVDFVAADMPHANRLTVGVMALVAEQEATAISQRTKAALAAAKKRGVMLGGDRGVRISRQSAAKGTAALVERSEGRARDLAPVIAEIQATGATSLRDIATALTDRNIPTARGGTEWTAMAVSRVLARIK